MKRYSIILVLLFGCVMGRAALYDAPMFRIPKWSKIEPLTLSTGLVTSKDTIIQLDIENPISGFVLSGNILLNSADAIVRVLMVDSKGEEYLVIEDFKKNPKEEKHFFSSVAKETVILDNVNPTKLKIFIRDAQLEISQITIVPWNEKLTPQLVIEQRRCISNQQEEYAIEEWNRINAETKQYWIAGKTLISGLSYSEKKIVLGATDDHYLSDGLEYYVGGFFVIKTHGTDITINDSQRAVPERENNNPVYADNFDWRNRHGKNWMTPVKNQIDPYNSVSGNGGCWAFGSLAALESHVNLYYNQLLDLDLSEQELGSCTAGSLHTGGNALQVYGYIQNNGISNESCFPFQNDATIPCSDKCNNPDYIAQISSYASRNSRDTTLKNELITKGPVASGYNNGYTEHLMCLCGYGTIYEGIHIQYAPQTPIHNIDTIIPANSDLIGKTYWIYKNSYGASDPTGGYLYVVFENDDTRAYTVALSYPVTVSTMSTSDIVCEDADNDGYYFWGLGPKPNNCPICCPDMPDGDDSNPQLAEMDNHGIFATYAFPYPTTTIVSNTTWNADTIHCGNIIVANNSTLTITAELTMNPAAKIYVQNGGSLVVDAGTIVNANIEVYPSAKFRLLHDGTVYLKQLGNLNVQQGAEAEMKYGSVLLQ